MILFFGIIFIHITYYYTLHWLCSQNGPEKVWFDLIKFFLLYWNRIECLDVITVLLCNLILCIEPKHNYIFVIKCNFFFCAVIVFLSPFLCCLFLCIREREKYVINNFATWMARSLTWGKLINAVKLYAFCVSLKTQIGIFEY